MWHVIVTYIDRLYHETGRKHLYRSFECFELAVDFIENSSKYGEYNYAYLENGHITLLETDDYKLNINSIIKTKIRYSSLIDCIRKNDL